MMFATGISIMTQSVDVERYSRVATFELVANGRSYSPSHASRDLFILDRPAEIPPCDADLYIRVEGEEMHRRIRLPQGASADSDRVVIERY
jgi:hypothetical protein